MTKELWKGEMEQHLGFFALQVDLVSNLCIERPILFLDEFVNGCSQPMGWSSISRIAIAIRCNAVMFIAGPSQDEIQIRALLPEGQAKIWRKLVAVTIKDR